LWLEGFAVRAVATCPNCYNDIDAKSKFCIYCGEARPQRILSRAHRPPRNKELIAFTIFGVLTCLVLWFSYGNLGISPRYQPSPAATAVAPGAVATLPQQAQQQQQPAQQPQQQAPQQQAQERPEPQAAHPLAQQQAPQQREGARSAASNTNQFHFEVPLDQFVQQSDGTLRSPDGRATISMWSGNGSLEQQRSALQNEHPNWNYTYRKNDPNYFVVSGYEGNNIFYQKTLRRGDRTATFLMKYPRSEKARYQDANEMLEATFRPR
jgi:hypothetical protein